MTVGLDNKMSEEISSIINSATQSEAPLIELTKDQKEKIKTVAGYALALVAVGGSILISAVAPNLFQVIGKAAYKRTGSSVSFKEQQKRTTSVFYYLKKRGLIQIETEHRGLVARITDIGKKKIQQLQISTIKIVKQKKWDRYWWLIAGDIPTKDYKHAADVFRLKLKELGFFPLQRTLWLYPYNPIKEIEFIANYYHIGNFITAMQISKLDKEDEIKARKHFKL